MKLPVLKNYVSSEGAVSHNVVLCLLYKVSFYANDYFEVITNIHRCL